MSEQREILADKSGSSISAGDNLDVAVTISGATGKAAGANGTYNLNSGVLNYKPHYQKIASNGKELETMYILYDSLADTNRWVIHNGLPNPSETRTGYIAGIDCLSDEKCDFSTLSEQKNWYLLDNGVNKVASSGDTRDMFATVNSDGEPTASTESAAVEPPSDDIMKQHIAQVKTNHTNVEQAYKKLTATSTGAVRTTFDALLTKAVTELTTAQQLLDAYKKAAAAAAVSPLSPTAEDKKIPDSVMKEYTVFYNAIISALFESVERKEFVGGLDKDTWADKIKSLTNSGQRSPKPPFLAAIKSRSLNSRAIPSISDNPDDINHNLMKAVFIILEPSRLMTEIGNIASFNPLELTSLDTLLTLLTRMLGEGTDISRAINTEYTKVVAPSSGGSSSSTSKKNRKSYKSYHPGIGKTRKHYNSHDEPKRVSFIHQA